MLEVLSWYMVKILGSSIEASSGYADSSILHLASLICGAVTICTMCHIHKQASTYSKQCPTPSRISSSQTQTSYSPRPHHQTSQLPASLPTLQVITTTAASNPIMTRPPRTSRTSSKVDHIVRLESIVQPLTSYPSSKYKRLSTHQNTSMPHMTEWLCPHCSYINRGEGSSGEKCGGCGK